MNEALLTRSQPYKGHKDGGFPAVLFYMTEGLQRVYRFRFG
jgi:hypothetical protein